MTKTLTKLMQTFTICLIVIIGAGVVYAWTDAPPNPPSGDADSPINVSNKEQVKQGSLGINGTLAAYSQICLGSGANQECIDTWSELGGGSQTLYRANSGPLVVVRAIKFVLQ